MTEIETLEKYNRMYKMALVEKKQLIIDSFVEYYGEQYRDVITERYNNIIFTWGVNHHISEFMEKGVLNGLIADYANTSSEILKFLGIDLSFSEIIPKEHPKIIGEYDSIDFTSGTYESVTGTNGEDLIPYLKRIFGEDVLYSFDNENTPIYNFESLDLESQKQFLRRTLKRKKINDEDFSNMRKAIEYMRGLSKKKEAIRDYFRNYVDFYRAYIYQKDLNDKKGSEIPSKENITGSSSERVLYDEMLLNSVLINMSSNFFATMVPLKDATVVSVVFPTVISPDSTIIHEIGHGLVTDPLLFYDEKGVCSTGTTILTDDNSIIGGDLEFNKQMGIEELLNELSSIEVAKIFHEKGGIISTFDERLLYKGLDYSVYFPLVQKFYDKYKDVIKESRIKGSRNLLINTIGKDKMDEFAELLVRKERVLFMRGVFKNKYLDRMTTEDYRSLYISSDFDEINALVESMPQPLSEEERKSREQQELNEMVQRLTSEGRKVTLLPTSDGEKTK